MGELSTEYVPHVYKEGARFHVLSWGGFHDSKGMVQSERYCSEPKCEINKPADLRRAALRNHEASE